MADLNFIRQLVEFPRESLATELKSWFDPTVAEGRAKIAKCALAMRNHGGGFMVIGVDDVTGLPTDRGRPDDLRAAFHIDDIQGLITRSASESFEVTVHFIQNDGHEFVVLEIPEGVRTPVALKSGINDEGNKPLLRENRVFVRTLDANGTPSSSEANWSDWRQLVDVCFDNREADIGRFVRRHLSGLSPEILRTIAANFQVTPLETDEQIVARVLDTGLKRFQTTVTDRRFETPAHGSWEVALLIPQVGAQPRLDLSFLNRVLSSNPNYTGWPTWLDNRNFGENSQPYLFDDEAWEAFIASLERPAHLDFWRIAPTGQFYLYRALDDDLGLLSHLKPMSALDFDITILRVAEAIAVGVAFAKKLVTPENAAAVFSFRWKGLKGRELSAWANPLRMLRGGRMAYRDEVVSTVAVPIETPPASLHSFVHVTTEPLFEAFSGFQVSSNIVEQLTNQLLQRRL